MDGDAVKRIPPADSPFADFIAAFAMDPCEKKMCIEMKTMVTPMQKLMVRACPNRAADMSPVKMVAIVEEYFFSMVSAYLKKKEDRMPCKALLTTKSMVTFE